MTSVGASVRDSVRPRVFFVCQPTVSHYREPLLRELLASEEIDVDLAGRIANGEVTAAEKIEEASAEVLGRVTPLRSVDFLGPLRWETGTISPVVRGEHDAYVLEGRVYTVSTWVALLVGRVLGRRVILWGHGWKRPEAGLKRRLRAAFYGLAHGHLFYGDRAKERGVSYGLDPERIRVIYNSLYAEADTGPAAAGRGRTGSARAASGPASPAPAASGLAAEDDEHDEHDRHEDLRPTLIFSARLTPRHRLDILAEALSEVPGEQRPRLVVVGDGSERPRLRRLFAERGIDADFLGPVYDHARLRELYSHADLAVVIGGAGLNVVQALGFGVPVLAEGGNPDSSPEIEAVVEGESGVFYRSGDAASLCATLTRLLDDPGRLRALGEKGLSIIRDHYTAERHAEAVRRAVQHFLRL